jgi:hypothetical protein
MGIGMGLFRGLLCTISIPSFAENLEISISILDVEKGKKSSGILIIGNFPKTVRNSMTLPSTIIVNGKKICTGKIRTQGYDAYFSSKCNGKSYRGNASINRTIKIAGRTINFIRRVSLKSGKSIIKITTGNSVRLR